MSTSSPPELEAAAFDYGKANLLVRELGLQRPTAVALVRRGFESVEAARSFLDEQELPPPHQLVGVETAVERLLTARQTGRRVTVFGDFDVDGVCGTTILIAALREISCECDWLIPDRISEGYGLSEAAVERLATRGTDLLVTVDCGITAVSEVAMAQRLGLEVIVTDHHQRGEQLPDCLIIHPGVNGYSCPNLCGAGVAWKLASALREAAGLPAGDESDLDLVALATVADLVPLIGENRTLVKRGMAVARRATRPGLRALLKVSATQPAGLNESDLGFRLAPRVNAAGRLYRADAGVELFLTDDAERAAGIADELNRANQERRDIELKVLGEAETALRRRRDEAGLPAGLVVAGEGWHPGVIGIVASRLVEQHRRPAVVISLDGEGRGRGSGRGVAGFDLLAALRGCDDLLARYGGHRAAAGLELSAEQVEPFAERFGELVVEQLGSEERPIRERVDAFAAGPELGLELAEELEKLGPFGIGNPGVNLVVPSAKITDSRPMGSDRNHLRFTVHSGGHRAAAIAFARQSLGCDEESHADLIIRLERNEWNGEIEPRLRLRELVVLDPPADRAGYRPECGDQEWWQRFEAALAGAPALSAPGSSVPSAPLPVSSSIDHRSGTGLAVLAELLTSGDPVLAVCADAGRRVGLAIGPAGVGRFARAGVSVCSSRDGRQRFRATLNAGFGLTDYASLAHWADELAAFPSDGRPLHLALIDPPALAEELTLAAQALDPEKGRQHRLWDQAARDFALKVLTESHDLRQPLAAIFRGLRDSPEPDAKAARRVLEGSGALPLSPEQAGLCVAILIELGLVAPLAGADAGAENCAHSLRVVSSKKTDLDSSRLYRSVRQQYEVKARFLRSNR